MKKKLQPTTNPSFRIKNKTETHQKEENSAKNYAKIQRKTEETNSQNCEI